MFVNFANVPGYAINLGFMKQLPNLLKQESSSAVTLVQVLLRLYADARPDHLAKRTETLEAFVPSVASTTGTFQKA